MQKYYVILGSGESGTGAALLARSLGYDVFVSDQGPIHDNFKQELQQHGIPFEENGHSTEKILAATEIVKSPGIPENAGIMQAIRAKNLPVIGEIELAWRHMGPAKVVGITGSNGKTTTTTLVHHLLEQAGMNTRAAGNVGQSFARLVAADLADGRNSDPSRIFVLELSSFQLDDVSAFRPDIAVLLNISPDHLDRYDYRLENYVRSKFRIAMNQKQGDLLIYNARSEPVGDFLARNPPSEVQLLGIEDDVCRDGILQVDQYAFDMRSGALRGPHNMFNAACAVQVALRLGADPARIQEGLNTYRPPAHRLEVIAVRNGITWINDSKATNVDSVYYALQSMEQPTVWIVGGQDKGNDYDPLVPLVRRHVKAIVCMGLDNTKIRRVFSELQKPLTETRSAEEAVRVAAGFARAGDTVLLSPACASFDLFKNYEHRGAQFREAVLNLDRS